MVMSSSPWRILCHSAADSSVLSTAATTRKKEDSEAMPGHAHTCKLLLIIYTLARLKLVTVHRQQSIGEGKNDDGPGYPDGDSIIVFSHSLLVTIEYLEFATPFRHSPSAAESQRD